MPLQLNIKPYMARHKAFGALLALLLCCAFGLLSLGVAACSSSEGSDVPELVIVSEYSRYFGSFSKDSRLPKPKNKPILRISQNHPRMAASPHHLLPISYGVAQALYENLDTDAPWTRYYIVSKYPTSRLEQGQDYADILFYRKNIYAPEFANLDPLRNLNPNMTETYIAKDALVFFTYKDNPISDLSLSQIQDIYSGKINNWHMVGGNNESIQPYQRQKRIGFSTASQQIMRHDVMRGLKMLSPAMHRVNDFSGSSQYKVVEYKNHPGALGYCTRWSLEMVVPPKKRKAIKILSVDGVFPTEENIHSGRYPLTYDIVAYAVKLEVSQETEAVISWLVSPEGKQYLSQLGYVPP